MKKTFQISVADTQIGSYVDSELFSSPITVDLTDDESIKNFFKEIISSSESVLKGHVDYLFSNEISFDGDTKSAEDIMASCNEVAEVLLKNTKLTPEQKQKEYISHVHSILIETYISGKPFADDEECHEDLLDSALCEFFRDVKLIDTETDTEYMLEDLFDDAVVELTSQIYSYAIKDFQDNNSPYSLLSSDHAYLEFIYVAGMSELGRGVVEDRPVYFDTNYSSHLSLSTNEDQVEALRGMFELFNVSPQAFASHLRDKGADSDYVSFFNNLDSVYTDDSKPSIWGDTDGRVEKLIEVIDNSYSCVVPTVFAKVRLRSLLLRDITQPFSLSVAQVGLHDFVNGAGYFETAKNTVIQPNDFSYTIGKPYRYGVDEVYGFSGHAVCAEIIQMPEVSLSKEETIRQVKDSLENPHTFTASKRLEFSGITELFDNTESGFGFVSDRVLHVKSLSNDESKVLETISNQAGSDWHKKEAVLSGKINKIVESHPEALSTLLDVGLVTKKSCAASGDHFYSKTPAGFAIHAALDSAREHKLDNDSNLSL